MGVAGLASFDLLNERSLKHQRAQGQQAATSVLSADRVELGSLAAIATRLPLQDPT